MENVLTFLAMNSRLQQHNDQLKKPFRHSSGKGAFTFPLLKFSYVGC